MPPEARLVNGTLMEDLIIHLTSNAEEDRSEATDSEYLIDDDDDSGVGPIETDPDSIVNKLNLLSILQLFNC